MSVAFTFEQREILFVSEFVRGDHLMWAAGHPHPDGAYPGLAEEDEGSTLGLDHVRQPFGATG